MGQVSLLDVMLARQLDAVGRTNLTSPVGRLSDQDLIRLNRALLVFLGLAV
jgi:mRNA-degrading endonuclease toxin of MazEF toxin-antitoxin module